MITSRRLFELAGIPVPYILLIEGYKEAVQKFAVQQTNMVFQYIKHIASPAVRALHNELWGQNR
jgi:hypothetical protein